MSAPSSGRVLSARLRAGEAARPVRVLVASAPWATALVGVALFCVAYDNGGYSLAGRSAIAVAVWWTILVGVGLDVLPRERLTRPAVLPGALLALFAGWELLSAAWSASPESAVIEFDRASLYLGIYVLVILTSRGRSLSAWIDGLMLAIVSIALIALLSRLFPGSFPSRGLSEALPSAGTRLSFPLGYWNGLGIFAALGFPLLLNAAVAGGRARRAAALGVLPALGAVVYLTSSRGALVALACGIAVFVAAERRHWVAFGASLAGLAGSALSIGVLGASHAVVDGPLDSAAARAQGWHAALLILGVCMATALAVEAVVAVAPRLSRPAPVTRRLAGAGIAALIVAGVAYQGRTMRDFAQLPRSSGGDVVTGHLLSGSGSGRWQFWTAALGQFRDAPLAGGGAGSFESWWARHGSFPYFVRDAHSLYLQTLGEVGVVGLLLLVGALGGGAAVGIARLRCARGTERTAIAGLLGAFTIFLVGAGVDWIWQLTAVTAAGICMLGLLAGPATGRPGQAMEPSPAGWASRRRLLVASTILLASVVVLAEAVVLLADVELSRSQADAKAGRFAAARSHAVAATRLEPWAGSPYLQLALVEQSVGRLAAARRAIDGSIHRDRADWRPWYVAAQIEQRLGRVSAASAARERAKSLNPRSPLLLSLPG